MTSLSSSINNDILNISSVKSLEEFNSTIKFQRKSIPSSLLAPSNVSNSNESSALPSTSTTQKPPVLKSILKQPSISSSNETRKAVQIVSTEPKDSTLKSTSIIATQISSTKPTVMIKPLVKKTFSAPEMSKLKINHNQTNKTSAVTKIPVRKIQIIPSKNAAVSKSNQPIPLKKLTMSNTNKSIVSKSISKITKNPKKSDRDVTKIISKIKPTSCMYDRIKERKRNAYVELTEKIIYSFAFFSSALSSIKDTQMISNLLKLKRQVEKNAIFLSLSLN